MNNKNDFVHPWENAVLLPLSYPWTQTRLYWMQAVYWVHGVLPVIDDQSTLLKHTHHCARKSWNNAFHFPSSILSSSTGVSKSSRAEDHKDGVSFSPLGDGVACVPAQSWPRMPSKRTASEMTWSITSWAPVRSTGPGGSCPGNLGCRSWRSSWSPHRCVFWVGPQNPSGSYSQFRASSPVK